MNAPSATSNAPSANGSASASASTNSIVRVAAAGLGQHPGGEVDAGDRRPAGGRGGGERPEPAADVEHA